MSNVVDRLLQPVSDTQPCGPDLSYDPTFDELEAALKGKPEVDIGEFKRPAEPPDWRQLRDQSAAFLEKSKHLRVAMMFSCSLLQTGGLTGFRDGLLYLSGLLQQYWATLYPLLDPEDNNDPTQRLNLLSALTAARGSIDSWLRFVDYLYATPLCQPAGAAPVTFDEVNTAKHSHAEGGSGGPDLAKLESAMRHAPAEQVASNCLALQQALEAVRGMDAFLTSTLGAGAALNFELLENTLSEMLAALQPALGGAGPVRGVPAASHAQPGTPVADSSTLTVSGSVRSRQDVVRALDLICDYYRQVEPSSPVPFLLRRAQKLATMDFVRAVQELNLGSLDSLRPSMGSALDEVSAPAPPPS